jgi:cytoskeleton-associated protein 5
MIACWTQYRHVVYTKMAADFYNVKDVTRLLQFVTMVLMSMYHHQDLTRKASMSTLHDLLHVFITILLEPKVQQLPEPDGGQLIRALNVLTVKILDRSDSINVTSAFIKLLRDCIGNTSLSPKFVELVMKCLWKVIRQLPKWMESNKLNLDLL